MQRKETFDEKLAKGRIAYRKVNPNGSITLSWLTPYGWQDKTIWGHFNADIFATKHGMKVIC